MGKTKIIIGLLMFLAGGIAYGFLGHALADGSDLALLHQEKEALVQELQDIREEYDSSKISLDEAQARFDVAAGRLNQLRRDVKIIDRKILNLAGGDFTIDD